MRERDALRSYALTNPLTNIANRRSLLSRAEYEIERHRRARRSFALVILDLVGLETVHASLGVALFPFDGSSAPELLDAADTRLLEAKRRLGAGRRGQRRTAA